MARQAPGEPAEVVAVSVVGGGDGDQGTWDVFGDDGHEVSPPATK